MKKHALRSSLMVLAVAFVGGCTAPLDDEQDMADIDPAEEATAEAAQALGTLTYSTYLGGAGDDYSEAIAVDGAGNAYVAGTTDSYGAWGDIFVAKYSPAGALLYHAILGGTEAETFWGYGMGLAVDAAGSAYVAARTASASGSILVAKLNPAGSALDYYVTFGAPGSADAGGIAVDAAGNAYVSGTTRAPLPATPGAFQIYRHGPSDAFVVKLNAAGNAFVYATYLGGDGEEQGGGIAVDALGNAYVTGTTSPVVNDYAAFPTTAGSFQPYAAGKTDTFVTKLNPTGSALVYSTYLAGDGEEEPGPRGTRIAIDSSSNAYVMGFSRSCSFPTTLGAYYDYNHECFNYYNHGDDFLTKLNASGTALEYSTFLGPGFLSMGFAVDGDGNAHIVGGVMEGRVIKLNATGTAPIYSIDIGGGLNGHAFISAATDSAGNTYAVGSTRETDFPTVAAAQPTNAGGLEATVVKLSGPLEWSPSYWTNDYSDSAGWNSSEAYWGTIEYPDINGDGKQDVCGRASAGIACALSNGTSFNTPTIWTHAYRDSQTWNMSESLWGTIQYPDINGDGKQDVCGRSSSGPFCALSNGTSFNAPTIWTNWYRNDQGWHTSESLWGTIQYPDLNGDGKQDVCGRSSSGLFCGLSNGTSFSAPINRCTSYSTAAGWGAQSWWKTIQYPDLNGDGKQDVCGRSSTGLRCALSNGSSFNAATLWTTAYSDAAGWNVSESHWGTIEFPDLNGDGKQDVCGRGAQGLYCALSNGSSFNAPSFWTGGYSNAEGWSSSESYWRTIEYPDLNGDGMQDVCGRDPGGVVCALSYGSSFSSPYRWTADYSDVQGWGTAEYYWGTIRFPDLDGDGSQDVCGRWAHGLDCTR